LKEWLNSNLVQILTKYLAKVFPILRATFAIQMGLVRTSLPDFCTALIYDLIPSKLRPFTVLLV